MNKQHQTITHIGHGTVYSDCKCGWVGAQRTSVVDARTDALEHINPPKPVVVAVGA